MSVEHLRQLFLVAESCCDKVWEHRRSSGVCTPPDTVRGSVIKCYIFIDPSGVWEENKVKYNRNSIWFSHYDSHFHVHYMLFICYLLCRRVFWRPQRSPGDKPWTGYESSAEKKNTQTLTTMVNFSNLTNRCEHAHFRTVGG